MSETKALIARFLYPVALEMLNGRQPFTFDFRILQLGPITIGDLRFGADVAIDTGDLQAYHVDLPLAGYLETEHRGNTVTASPDRAAIYRPIGRTVLRRWSPDFRQLSIKIEKQALETELESLLGHPIRGPLRLGPTLDTRRGAGRTWARLAGMLRDEFDNGGAAIHPLLGERLSHSVLTGLLLAADHQYRRELSEPAEPSRPRAVKRVIDAIHTDPGRAFTSVELAELAGASVRSLQEGFQRHLGLSPMAYLRQVRLDRAHDELHRADPGTVTVAEVVHRWGFGHLGRFAAAYRSRYGVRPSQTLRG
ncbi:AraC family transcriptional regulator [Micromonospora sp. NPDC049679]|uniref:AraC family transcriptional regulator n=1 Tax=Micromonospora sp. NPDC049679 TaxID=3155920 RepID=UPI0033EE7E4F